MKGTYLGGRRALLWFSNQIMRYMWLLLLNIEFNLFDRTISFQLWPMTTTSSVASVKSMLPSSHGQLHRMMVRWLDMEKYDKVCFSQLAQVLFGKWHSPHLGPSSLYGSLTHLALFHLGCWVCWPRAVQTHRRWYLLPLFQIIIHSKNLEESKFFKFYEIYITR